MIDKEDENHELDDFIRQKLNNIHIEFDEQAWLDLRGKLHTFNRQKANYRTKLLWTRLSVAAAIVLTIPAFVLAYYNLSVKQARDQVGSQNIEEKLAPDKGKEGVNQSDLLSEKSLKNPQHLEPDQAETEHYNSSKKQQTDHSLNNSDLPENANQNDSSTEIENKIFNQHKNNFKTSTNTKKLNAYNKTTTTNPNITVQIVDHTSNQNQIVNQETNANEVLSKDNYFFNNSIDPIAALGLAVVTEPHNNTIVPQLVAIDEAYNLKSKRRSHPIHLGFSFSPELDQVGIAQKNTWSVNMGGFAEWSVGKHLDLRFGLSYTKKRYKVIDFDKAPPAGADNVILNSGKENFVISESSKIRAQMIDIPIELKYTFAQDRKVRFFIAAGPSAYLYLNQSIDRKTDVINPTTDFRVNLNESFAEVKKNKLHLFSTWNMGIGVETNIFYRIKAQINPYYKFALKDTGAEGNQISSFGIRTLLLYNLN